LKTRWRTLPEREKHEEKLKRGCEGATKKRTRGKREKWKRIINEFWKIGSTTEKRKKTNRLANIEQKIRAHGGGGVGGGGGEDSTERSSR